jgi:short-subunit dehydrogenase
LPQFCGQQSRVQVTVLPADLSAAEEISRLVEEVKSRVLKIDFLINNAGFGIFENFLDTPLQPQIEQLDVNVRALVALTHAFTPGMVAAKRGGVINIASTAAFQPLAGADVYAATKALCSYSARASRWSWKRAGFAYWYLAPVQLQLSSSPT